MSDKMRPIPFESMLDQIFKEYHEKGTIYEVPVCRGKRHSYIGPAAGPHTQLAQNIIAAYIAGANHFELKTVQILEGEELGIKKPCIYVEEEAYNTEWSTELSILEALEEYIKAYVLLHLLAREFEFGDEEHITFYMSVGYSLRGIQSKGVDYFIESLKDASNTRIWKECIDVTLHHIEYFTRVTKEEVNQIRPQISNRITLSTMHGCPVVEIDQIVIYLLERKQCHVYVKCNPTLVGYDKAREIVDTMGYGYMKFSREAFEKDISFDRLVGLIRKWKDLANCNHLLFGVKLTNTLPVIDANDKLTGEEMYMSGPPLYPFAIGVSAMLSKVFDGDLIISYSGGADEHNIVPILETGIYPVTVSTLLLKQGGYKNITKLNKKIGSTQFQENTRIDIQKIETLAKEAMNDEYYYKKPEKLRKDIQEEYSSFCSKCKNCIDVCPNRANVSVYLKNKKYVIHKDSLCNECGNCSHFCIMKRNPYRDKFTLFESEVDYQNSQNEGIFKQNGIIRIRRDFQEESMDMETFIIKYPQIYEIMEGVIE